MYLIPYSTIAIYVCGERISYYAFYSTKNTTLYLLSIYLPYRFKILWTFIINMTKQIINLIRQRISKAEKYFDSAKEQGSEDYHYWQGYMDGLDQLEDEIVVLDS
jgi:ERCC4-type nuclease